MAEDRKGFNFFKSYFDVYRELSNNDKVKFMNALLERQFWGVEPLDLKGMSNFAYISQKHNIDAQVKGYEDKTGYPLHPPTAPPTEGGIYTPTEQVKGEVKGEEKGEEELPACAPFVFKKSLLDYGFEKQLVEDFLKNRKTKKLTNTKTAYDSFIEEIEKTRRDKNELFKIIVQKGWGGFKSSWPIDENNNNNGATSPHHNIDKNANYDEQL